MSTTRPATVSDVDALYDLEKRCFSSDLMSRRSIRYLLTKAHASVFVWEDDARRLAGSVVVLYSRATALARLYSISVDSTYRGRGVGRSLLAMAEEDALNWGCVSMRAEVRRDNAASLALFRKAGYTQFEEIEDYYEDHMEAIRLERDLVRQPERTQLLVPYFQQTTDFTCGPACLMMAMRAIDQETVFDRRVELRLWRETTSIFMTSGHGGCGPFGLALAAHRHGFKVEVFVNECGTFLVDTVRDPEKKEVMRIVEEDYLAQLAAAGVEVVPHALPLGELLAEVEAGVVPLLLISSYRIYGERFPHWVVVTGYDDHFVFVHDPFVDYEEGETVSDCIAMPIARVELERMARYGRTGQRAALLISKK